MQTFFTQTAPKGPLGTPLDGHSNALKHSKRTPSALKENLGTPRTLHGHSKEDSKGTQALKAHGYLGTWALEALYLADLKIPMNLTWLSISTINVLVV